ncbi:hypothetical protein [Thermocoleostomius sinensis]|uniref:Uncharacterized protein n=1 Tax=Thermocoleostomius sinensis A174 TaxID=2016057 RepID=A0A9E9CB68_9CYAN|nr:hypothetical protein [Thermocoleostomius sinensis]WAL59930.1 hypothetical protein OXH18_22605 [Thermocoleostomius sinensis A174]
MVALVFAPIPPAEAGGLLPENQKNLKMRYPDELATCWRQPGLVGWVSQAILENRPLHVLLVKANANALTVRQPNLESLPC